MNNEDLARKAARAFMENMVAESLLAQRLGAHIDPRQVVDSGFDNVGDTLTSAVPLARLMDQSDIVFHAEGPGAVQEMPWIGALTWLLTSVETNLRKLSIAALDLWGADGRTLGKHVDMRIPGIVPGSIWVGVKLAPPGADLLPEDTELVARIAQQFKSLPVLTRYIGDERLDEDIRDIVPDPALRDVQLAALYKLAPTGRKGIHTVELSSQTQGSASLSQRERVVLREAVIRPTKRGEAVGSFVGDVREADLDKTRMHLRNVDGVGTLRCVLPDLTADRAASLLGKTVRVSGTYQTDREGRPRLMFVEAVEPFQVQHEIEADD